MAFSRCGPPKWFAPAVASPIKIGITYLTFPVAAGIRYVPGLDVYVACGEDSSLRWLRLYEDLTGARI